MKVEKNCLCGRMVMVVLVFHVASKRFTVSIRQRNVKHLSSLMCVGCEEAGESERKGAEEGKGE